EHLGMHEVGDEGSQPVVVTEAQLVGGYGVVLVDDRDNIHRQQPFQRPLCVSVVLPADEVFGGEQYLANSAVVVGEGLAVASHEDALTDRGDGLASGKVLRTRGESQWRDSGGDGA